jgi:glycosyltransferase involved in cell wall biosynthesis
MNSNLPTVTVITCSLVADEKLIATLRSVQQQKNVNVENIVISPDRRIEEIEVARNSQRLVRKSNGVYDAMNAGLELATSQFCMFLNSGDSYIGSYSIANLLKNVDGHLWGYGGIKRIHKSGKKSTYRFLPYSQLLHKFGLKYVPHPASFVDTATAKKFAGFDESFPIAADQKLLLQFSLLSKPIVKRHLVVEFDMGGLSSGRNYSEISRDFSEIRDSIHLSNHFEMLSHERVVKVIEKLYYLRKYNQ